MLFAFKHQESYVTGKTATQPTKAIASDRLPGAATAHSTSWTRHLTPGRVTFAAGLMVFLAGGVPAEDLSVIAQSVMLPLLSLLGLSVIALSVHEVGVFAWCAHMVAKNGRGDARRLFTNLYFLAAILTILFPNDATILLFTPLVINILLTIKDDNWRPNSLLPFLFVIVFGANAGSIALVTSNPINMIYAKHFNLEYLDFAALMIVPSIVSIIVCYFLLRLAFKNDLPKTYRLDMAPSWSGNATSLPFRAAVVIVIAMFVSYFLLSAMGLGYHIAIFIGCGVVLWPLLATKEASPKRVMQRLPWDEMLFVTGMFVIAGALAKGVLNPFLAAVLGPLSEFSFFGTAIGNASFVTLGANLINDWPTAMLTSFGIDALPSVDAASKELMVYSSVLSANLGNKIIPSGSLATLIWIGVIWRIARVRISWGQFIRVGLIVTPLTMLAAALTLWIEFALFK